MKNDIFKNNIFTNPKGWAENLIGSSFRYRLMQALSVFLGVSLAGFIFPICRKAGGQAWEGGYVCLLALLVIAAIQLPLFYLRALRFYVVESLANEQRK